MRYLLLLFLHASFLCADQRTALEEANVLAPLFRSLCTYTEAGYVFYGQKPVCVEGFSEDSCVFEPSEWHQLSVAICTAKKILQDDFFRSGEIILHVDDKEKILLIINRKLLFKTIQDNLTLFQYVLGPATTPHSLLKNLLSPEKSFMSVLNHDKILIGIVLGFGVQNSIFVSRLEEIQDGAFNYDNPPHSPRALLCREEFEKETMLFFPTASERKRLAKNSDLLTPSSGFSSLREEEAELQKKIQISSEKLSKTRPHYIFGCIEKEKDLVSSLETTQEKIRDLLESPKFLSSIFECVSGQKIELEDSKTVPLPLSNLNVNAIVAKLLRNSLEGYDERYFANFVQGFKEEENDDLDPGKQLLGFSEAIKNIETAKRNLDEAQVLFARLQKDQTFTPILKSSLYYKVLERGKGKPLYDETKVHVDFEIFDPSGKCLKSASNVQIDLQDTIAGFAHGLQKMQTGEKRVIYIHPSLAYGVHTYLEKGIYLKAVVRLLEIEDEKGELPHLVPNDIAFVQDELFQEECKNEHKKALRFLGMLRGRFLKKCPPIDTELVAEHFLHIKTQYPLVQNELDVLNRIFWNYYFVD